MESALPRRLTLAISLAITAFLGSLLAGPSQDAAGDGGQPTTTPPAPSPPSKLDRGTVYVAVDESLDGTQPEVNYPRAILYRFLSHHGFTRAKKRSAARFVITGSVTCAYDKPVYFKFNGEKVLIEHQYVGNSKLEVVDLQAEPAEPVAIPAIETRSGQKDKDGAADDIRRNAATEAARALISTGPLAEPVTAELLALIRDGKDSERPLAELMDALALRGSPAVPYLLDCFLDDVPVPRRSVPDPRRAERDGLLTYHVADRVLKRIFGEPGFFDTHLENDRVGAFKYWMRKWEKIQDLPKSYRLPPED